MSKKLLEFNRIYSELIIDITKVFNNKEEDSTIQNNINLIKNKFKIDDKFTINNFDNSSNIYLDYYINNVIKIMDKISTCDENIFNNDIYLIEELNFKNIWKYLSLDDKTTLWKYFHTLYILATSTLEIHKLLEKITDIDIINNIDNNTKIISLIVESRKRLAILKLEENKKNNNTSDTSDTSNNTSNNTSNDTSNDIGNFITGIADEISSEINMDDLNNSINNPADIFNMMMSGGNNSSLSKIIETVSSKLTNKIESGELDQQKLFADAQNMMSSLGSNPMNFMNEMNKANTNKNGHRNTNHMSNRKMKRKLKKKILKKPPSVKDNNNTNEDNKVLKKDEVDEIEKILDSTNI